jgi:hypothetical protein
VKCKNSYSYQRLFSEELLIGILLANFITLFVTIGKKILVKLYLTIITVASALITGYTVSVRSWLVAFPQRHIEQLARINVKEVIS